MLLPLMLAAACGNPEQANRHVQQAETFYVAGNFLDARVELKNALRLNPDAAPALYLMALINEQDKDAGAAIKNLEAAIKADPQYLAPLIKLGHYYIVGRQVGPAREMAERALAIDPDHAPARLLNARIRLLVGNPQGALQEAEAALNLDPLNFEAVSFVALLQAQSKQGDAALETIDDAISRAQSANDVQGVYYLHNTAAVIITDEFSDAAGIETQLSKRAARYDEVATYDLALIKLYQKQARLAEATQLLQRMLAQRPDNAQRRIRLAQMQAAQSDIAAAEQTLVEGLKRNPNDAALIFAQAALLESVGRVNEAIAIYDELAAQDPLGQNGLKARNQKVRIYLELDPPKAKRQADAILKDDRRNLDASIYKSILAVRNNNLSAATEILRFALLEHRRSERALLMLARLYMAQGMNDQAERTYGKLLAVNPVNKQALKERALLAQNSDDLDNAEALLREATRADPDSDWSSKNLVITFLRQKKFAAAEAELRRQIQAIGADNVSAFRLGLALEGQNKTVQAIAAYRQSVELYPTLPEPLNRLIILLLASDQIDQAESLLSELSAEFPTLIHLRLLQADLLAATERQTEAAKIYRQIIVAATDNIGAYAGLAALQEPGSVAQSTILAEGVAANPNASALSLALGVTYTKQKNYEAAIETYGAALSQSDNDSIAANLAALLLNYRTDKDSYKKALELTRRFAAGPQHPLSLGVLGWAYHQNGDYQNALRYLEQAAAGTEQNPQLHYYLGKTYLNMGQAENARRELKAALDQAEEMEVTFAGRSDAAELYVKLEAETSE